MYLLPQDLIKSLSYVKYMYLNEDLNGKCCNVTTFFCIHHKIVRDHELWLEKIQVYFYDDLVQIKHISMLDFQIQQHKVNPETRKAVT